MELGFHNADQEPSSLQWEMYVAAGQSTFRDDEEVLKGAQEGRWAAKIDGLTEQCMKKLCGTERTIFRCLCRSRARCAIEDYLREITGAIAAIEKIYLL